jgi:hypothetical protein
VIVCGLTTPSGFYPKVQNLIQSRADPLVTFRRDKDEEKHRAVNRYTRRSSLFDVMEIHSLCISKQNQPAG